MRVYRNADGRFRMTWLRLVRALRGRRRAEVMVGVRIGGGECTHGRLMLAREGRAIY